MSYTQYFVRHAILMIQALVLYSNYMAELKGDLVLYIKFIDVFKLDHHFATNLRLVHQTLRQIESIDINHVSTQSGVSLQSTPFILIMLRIRFMVSCMPVVLSKITLTHFIV